MIREKKIVSQNTKKGSLISINSKNAQTEKHLKEVFSLTYHVLARFLRQIAGRPTLASDIVSCTFLILC